MARPIRLLHVEDDPMQQAVIAHHLKRMADFHFTILCVSSEDRALAEFRQTPSEIVIVDYHLSQGDGLSCVSSLRREDPIVPIIAVSGQATAEIASQLLQNGADDYLAKRDLNADNLARSVRMALARADAYRRRTRAPHPDIVAVKAALVQVCKGFLVPAGQEFLTQLDNLEAAARDVQLTADQLPPLYETVCAELTASFPNDLAAVRRFLRPILLELQFRLAVQKQPLD